MTEPVREGDLLRTPGAGRLAEANVTAFRTLLD